jgi:hypothetical protein
MLHLALHRLRKHVIQSSRLGDVDENATIARSPRKAILDVESIVLIDLVGDQVPARGAKTHKETIPNDKWLARIGVLIELGNVHMPSREILPVEERE